MLHYHLRNLLIVSIVAHICNNVHHITTQKVDAHTNIYGNNKTNKLQKSSSTKDTISRVPFHFTRHHASYQTTSILASIQHDRSILNLKQYIGKEHLSSTVSYATNTCLYVAKWLNSNDMYTHNSQIHFGTQNTLVMLKSHNLLNVDMEHGNSHKHIHM